MADPNGVDLRRALDSADLFSERAITKALFSLKTPDFKSIALLVRVTLADQRPVLAFFRARTGRRKGFETDFFVAMGAIVNV
jgi:hypothetical protein